jgi:hypothetical protein
MGKNSQRAGRHGFGAIHRLRHRQTARWRDHSGERKGPGAHFNSGYSDSVIAKQGVLEDNVNLIPKPFSIADLAAAVRRVLDAA